MDERCRWHALPVRILVRGELVELAGSSEGRWGPRGRETGWPWADHLRAGRQHAPEPAWQGKAQEGQCQRRAGAEAPGQMPGCGRGTAQGERRGGRRAEDQRRPDYEV